MLMQTDRDLLRRLETMDRMDTPSLARLSYLLRHHELWPEDFSWHFDNCECCAMGLASAFWQLDPEQYEWTDCDDVVDCHLNMVHTVLGVHKSTCMILFLNERTYGVSSEQVTPNMVADKIDEYLAKQRRLSHADANR